MRQLAWLIYLYFSLTCLIDLYYYQYMLDANIIFV